MTKIKPKTEGARVRFIYEGKKYVGLLTCGKHPQPWKNYSGWMFTDSKTLPVSLTLLQLGKVICVPEYDVDSWDLLG